MGNFTFSEDSKYLFDGSGVYDLEAKRTVTKLKIVPFTGRSVTFLPNSHSPVNCGVDGVRIWDFPYVNDISLENFVNFKTSNDGTLLICEKYSKSTEEKEFQLIDLVKKKKIGKKVVSKESTIGYDISPDGQFFSFLEMSTDKSTENFTANTVHVYSCTDGTKIHSFQYCTKAFFTTNPNVMLVDSAV